MARHPCRVSIYNHVQASVHARQNCAQEQQQLPWSSPVQPGSSLPTALSPSCSPAGSARSLLRERPWLQLGMPCIIGSACR